MTFPKCEPFQFSDSSGPRYLWGVRLEDSTGQEKIVEHQRIGGCGGKTGEEWARLFAAAPDLLAALEDAVAACKAAKMGVLPASVFVAIAKATGV